METQLQRTLLDAKTMEDAVMANLGEQLATEKGTANTAKDAEQARAHLAYIPYLSPSLAYVSPISRQHLAHISAYPLALPSPPLGAGAPRGGRRTLPLTLTLTLTLTITRTRTRTRP